MPLLWVGPRTQLSEHRLMYKEGHTDSSALTAGPVGSNLSFLSSDGCRISL